MSFKITYPMLEASWFERMVGWEALKGFSGMHMFCPFSGRIMDVKRTVELSLYDGEKLLSCKHFDESVLALTSLEDIAARVARDFPAGRLEVTHGRWWGGDGTWLGQVPGSLGPALPKGEDLEGEQLPLF
jgi:hypothetical protein